MSRREQLKKIAESTMDILKSGQYRNSKNEIIEIGNDVKSSVENTVLYNIKDTNDLLMKIKANPRYTTELSTTKETTLQAAKRLKEKGYDKVLALNFASARHAGGGFLNGASAQEESLARSSGLYFSLVSKPEMYEYNENLRSGRYSDYMIYSPNVPVFKLDSGELLDTPYPLSFITSPAVNKGFIQQREPHISQSVIDSIMKKRIEKIIALAIFHNYETLVLGAFGCGVFKNKAKDVSKYFHDVLSHPKYKGQFKEIVFAVYDSTENQAVYGPFDKTFN